MHECAPLRKGHNDCFHASGRKIEHKCIAYMRMCKMHKRVQSSWRGAADSGVPVKLRQHGGTAERLPLLTDLFVTYRRNGNHRAIVLSRLI